MLTSRTEVIPRHPGGLVVSKDRGPYLLHAVKSKSRDNLKASMLLLDGNLVDPAMSRMYYALFQGGIYALEKQGRKPRDFKEADDWKHDTVSGNANLLRSRREDLHLFQEAKALRVQADYKPVPVNRRRVEQLLPMVVEILNEIFA